MTKKYNIFKDLPSLFKEEYSEKNITFLQNVKDFCIGLKVFNINVSLINYSEIGTVSVYHVIISSVDNLAINSNIFRFYTSENKGVIKSSTYSSNQFEIQINNEDDLLLGLKKVLSDNWVKKEIKRISTTSVLF